MANETTPFEAYRRATHYQCINCDGFHPAGQLCPEFRDLTVVETGGIRLEMTCSACPEQYDAYIDDQKVGYLRLRHGRFTVEVPDPGGKLVYSAHTVGDGAFHDAAEADYYLTQAKLAILAEMNQ
jgi:hypothetical protein